MPVNNNIGVNTTTSATISFLLRTLP